MAARPPPDSGALSSNHRVAFRPNLSIPRPILDNTNTTFPLFPTFPLELRSLVWSFSTFSPDILKVHMHLRDCKCERCENGELTVAFFTTKQKKCTLNAVSREARAIARMNECARLPVADPLGYIAYDPDVTTIRITNFRELLSSVRFDDTLPNNLVPWLCPDSWFGQDITRLAIDIRHIFYPLRHHNRGVWHELVWVSLLRKMFHSLTTIMVITDPKNTGYVFQDSQYLTSHEGDDENEYETEDELGEFDSDGVFHLPYEKQAGALPSFYDEQDLNPRIFTGYYSAEGWHEDVDGIQGWVTDFLANITETLGRLEPTQAARMFSILHCEGRDGEGRLILRKETANLKEDRELFQSHRLLVSDYDDEYDGDTDDEDEEIDGDEDDGDEDEDDDEDDDEDNEVHENDLEPAEDRG